MIIVTEKDAVKIPDEVAREQWNIPIFVISVEVTFQVGAAEFEKLLRQRLEEKIGKK